MPGLRIFSAIFAGGAMLVSSWPGAVDWLFDGLLLLLLLPLVVVVWAVVVVQAAIRDLQPGRSLRRASGIHAVAIHLAAAVLIAGECPLRIAFNLARPAMEAVLDTSDGTLNPESAGNRHAGWFGPCHVDSCAESRHGGVYFRTRTTLDLIDRVSHGFVFRPNGRTSPFGAAAYRLRPLGGEWFVFHASDDFHLP